MRPKTSTQIGPPTTKGLNGKNTTEHLWSTWLVYNALVVHLSSDAIPPLWNFKRTPLGRIWVKNRENKEEPEQKRVRSWEKS
ncbi:hypothetical protein NPIL_531771 [Nephila pilipes]|uniref:Uncharacterized protein n=1 Tax=Nephila pilipes TaxID=299642 RepID=A0A8X6QMX7_NEPPI|nr:hypothetical protein NPIL_531771 [Nephila pilipes]